MLRLLRREIYQLFSDHGILTVCINYKESLIDVTFTNVDHEIYDKGNEKNETSTISSTQMIIKTSILSQIFKTPTLIATW